MEQYSITPLRSPMKLDVMVGSSFCGHVSFPCQVGIEYTYDELMAFARMRKLSLNGKDF